MKQAYWLRGAIIGSIVLFVFICYSVFLVPKRIPSPDVKNSEVVLQLVKTFPAREFIFQDCAYRSDLSKDERWYVENCLSHQTIDFYSGIINIGLYTLLGFLGGGLLGWFYGKVARFN